MCNSAIQVSRLIFFHLADLSELLVEIRRVDQRPLLDFRVKEIFVPRDEKGSQKFLHLHSDIHGHWNDEVEEHHEGQEVCEPPRRRRKNQIMK